MPTVISKFVQRDLYWHRFIGRMRTEFYLDDHLLQCFRLIRPEVDIIILSDIVQFRIVLRIFMRSVYRRTFSQWKKL